MADPVQTALKYLGTPYRYGGNGACGDGVDCSGLTHLVYPNLPRTAHDQYNATQRVTPDQLQPGDLVFLQGTQKALGPGKASHVGIYDGQGNVIAAPHTGSFVQKQPLASWQGKNLLGYGRVAQVAGRQQKPGPTQVPQMSQAQPLPQSPGQGGDLYSYLAGVAAGRPQAQPMHLYDPFSATTAPNPDYNPAPTDALSQSVGNSSGLDLAGMLQAQPQQGAPYKPYNDQQTIQQPSLYDQYSQTAQSAQQQQPNPEASKVAEIQATAKLHQSLADLFKANPAAQYQIEDYLPFPMRQQAQIPGRPAPQFDPLSGGLAALAGIIDPMHSGQYGSAPLQAGIDVAGQQYGDALRNYQMQAEQLAQQYEHDLAARNDLAHYQQRKSGANFENATANRAAQLQMGEQQAQASSNGSLADVLNGVGEQQKQAAGTGLQANLLNDQIQRQLGQNAAQVQYSLANQKNDNDIYKTLLSTVGHGYGADQRLQGQQVAADSRVTVGAGHDQAHLGGIGQQQAGANQRNAATNATKVQTTGMNNAASKYRTDKSYDAAIQRINSLHTRAASLAGNGAVPANLRSQLTHWDNMTRQTHNSIAHMLQAGQQPSPELLAEQTANAAAYQTAVQQADDWVRTHSAATGTPQAAPAAPVIRGNGFTLTPR